MSIDLLITLDVYEIEYRQNTKFDEFISAFPPNRKVALIYLLATNKPHQKKENKG